jgi:hypothetical protein
MFLVVVLGYMGWVVHEDNRLIGELRRQELGTCLFFQRVGSFPLNHVRTPTGVEIVTSAAGAARTLDCPEPGVDESSAHK